MNADSTNETPRRRAEDRVKEIFGNPEMTFSTPAPRVRAKLTNGTSAEIWDVPNAVGVERGSNDPRTVAEADGIFYLLTDCCGASAKGSSDADGAPYLVCRNCYEETRGDEGAPVPKDGFIPLLPGGLWR